MMGGKFDFDLCPTCDETFSSISQHWAKSECSCPEPTPKQQDALAALVISGGTIKNGRKYTYTTTTGRDCLDEIDDDLGLLSCGVNEYDTSIHNTPNYRLSLISHEMFSNGMPSPEEVVDMPIDTLPNPRVTNIREYLYSIHGTRDDWELYTKLNEKHMDSSLLNHVLSIQPHRQTDQNAIAD